MRGSRSGARPGGSRLILFNKPFGVVSQFSAGASPDRKDTLGGWIDCPGVYPAGRLDKDSEGLLLLTDDGPLQARIAEPRFKLPKTYLVQVEGDPSEDDLEPLRGGIRLKDGLTRPAAVERICAPDLWPRDPPVRFRKSVPDCWLRLTLREGRNRQVRRMTAAIGCPTLRLVRWRIGPWSLDGLARGDCMSIPARHARTELGRNARIEL
ncbi:pseudouridine synthase [Halovulum dunhuangense]|uniref:Pseudouridine synthase n=1 Tax=Halovulum dunhuangense TaxID=1505036 RepID=A0A849L6E9_9RHOB|nr:pseudouridine synthase [Halovulum dunhuangense]NNU82098.1 pseudouridine synthase [Halovulum dunhuangense]